MNFAISTRSQEEGVDHLGIQVENQDELTEITERLKKADLGVYDEGETTCCYAESNKAWVQVERTKCSVLNLISSGMRRFVNHKLLRDYWNASSSLY